MRHMPKTSLAVLFLLSGILAGCATVIPAEYAAIEGKNTLPGPILALAGEGDTLVAANPDGVYLKNGAGNWKELAIPGITDPGKVTALAVMGGEICVGTNGEGLHILSEGIWEMRTQKYGGLPDDRVLSLAFDGPENGLPGKNLWVGTETGLALRGPRGWESYVPEGEWLLALTEKVIEGESSTYLGSGFGIGRKGDDSKSFRPPVTAISCGPDGVVLGGSGSGFAIIRPEGLATLSFQANVRIQDLLMEQDMIWVGTDAGLVWGGLSGKNLGTPWPAHRKSVSWTGTLFATRDARPFFYEWGVVGYNTGKVLSLAREKDSLWVSHGKPDPQSRAAFTDLEDSSARPITNLRRYLNINDHILRKEAYVYETYDGKVGIPGDATDILYLPESGGIWVGTSQGLFPLKK